MIYRLYFICYSNYETCSNLQTNSYSVFHPCQIRAGTLVFCFPLVTAENSHSIAENFQKFREI